MYDNNGDPFGFIHDGEEYYYIKNAQNDVTGITYGGGTVAANYSYDAWGRVEKITGDTRLARLNPIRYRSYYYDLETEWYYLNTRYYSPEMCRFYQFKRLRVLIDGRRYFSCHVAVLAK